MDSLNVRLNSGMVTVSDSEKNVVNFDLEGRPIFMTVGGVTFRRGLNNRLIQLSWKDKERIIETPGPDESRKILERSMSYLSGLEDQSDGDTSAILRKISGRDYPWIIEDSRKISSLYRVYPILPPDASHFLYFEGSFGASWNLSTITSSHTTREFQSKTEEEIKAHADSIKNVMGEGIKSKKGVFLGDANAMNMDQKALLHLLDLLKNEFSLPIMSAFDMYTTPKKKNMIHFRDMKDHGLDHVSVFLQSGSYKVLRLFNEHTNATETLNLVNNLKDSGLTVSIVAMVGTGGVEYARDHEEGISNVISQMPLDSKDRVYLSPIVEDDDPWYTQMESSKHITRMNPAEKISQASRLSEKIKESFKGINGYDFPGTIALYDLREAIY